MSGGKVQESWANDESSDDDSVEEQVEEQQQQPQSHEENQPQQQDQRREKQQYDQPRGRNDNYHSKRENYEDVRDSYRPPKSDFIVHVSNLAFSVNDDILGQFFHEGGCSVVDAHVYIDNGKSRGTGVVILSDEKSFEQALSADGVEHCNRRLSVKARVGGKPQDRGYNRQGRGDARVDRGGFKDREGYRRDGPRDNPRNRDDRREKGSDQGNDSARAAEAPQSGAPPAARPKVIIADRTLPIEKVGEFIGSPSGIFGAAKARNEVTYEEKKKTVTEAENAETPLPPAPPAAEGQQPPEPSIPSDKPHPPKQHRHNNDFYEKGERTDKRRDDGGRGDGGRWTRAEPGQREASGRGSGRGEGRGGGRGEAGRGHGRGEGNGRGEGGRGNGRGEGGRGRGREYIARGGGRGRGGEYPKRDASGPPVPAHSSEPKVCPQPKAKKVEEADTEEVAMAKFNNAQEKLLKKEQHTRAQASKKGEKQIVNTFGALQLDDDSDEEA